MMYFRKKNIICVSARFVPATYGFPTVCEDDDHYVKFFFWPFDFDERNISLCSLQVFRILLYGLYIGVGGNLNH